MNILIIEDESQIRNDIVNFLRQQNYTVEFAEDYNSADEKLSLYNYDCAIVDIMLPDGSGLDLIKKLKKNNINMEMGIIVVSARDATEEKIIGLECGADDYLAKPFSLAELNARINAVIRRRNFKGSDEFVFNEIKIIVSNREVYINNHLLSLTKKEYDMLLYFMMNKGRVLSKESIVEHLWGDSMGITADSFDFIYTHIRNLRSKMLDMGANDYIKTVYAVGYRFTDE